jgi:acyl carrier protein
MSTPLSSSPQRAVGRPTADAILALVLGTIRTSNLSRDEASQLEVAPGATLFGAGSPLDSLGLVALLLDLEDELRAAGWPVALGDERAMSQKRSPFRTVGSLVEYIATLLRE